MQFNQHFRCVNVLSWLSGAYGCFGLVSCFWFLHFLLWDSLFQPKQPLSTMKLHFAWTRHGFSSPQLTRPIFVKLFWHWPKGNLWCCWFSVPVDHVGVVGLAVQVPPPHTYTRGSMPTWTLPPRFSSLVIRIHGKPVLVALTRWNSSSFGLWWCCDAFCGLFRQQCHQRGPIQHPALASETPVVGRTTWHGPGFYGNQTASGEILQKNTLTAAHGQLPLARRSKWREVR